MMKLGLLMLTTLIGLFTVLTVFGDDDLRADRRPVPVRQVSAAQDAGAPALPAPAAPLPEEAPAQIIPAASQTAPQVQRFPGPALTPSPEHAGQAPEAPPAAAEGPVLYVTANRVNMRSGPGTGNPVIAGIDRGTAVQALGPVDGDWVQIRTPGGQTGFASGQFLSSEAP